MDSINSADFDITVDTDPHNTDAEAALEALRAAIGSEQTTDDYTNAQQHAIQDHAQGSSSDIDPPNTTGQSGQSSSHNITDSNVGLSGSIIQQQTVEKLLASLNQLSSTNITIIDQLNVPSLLQGLAGSLELLVKSNKRQAELIRTLNTQFSAGFTGNIDPTLSGLYVPKGEYDALKQRYDQLAASVAANGSSAGPSRRAKRGGTVLADMMDDGGSPSTPNDEKNGGIRKRRSIKLEHLVHKMANRRLGVEYAISGFETKGSKDLPDPTSTPPTAAESQNGIEEYRPDFRGDVGASSVRPFIERVVEDCVEAWDAGLGQSEPDVDRRKIAEAVQVYWARLSKRWDEQQARDRGEVHKDEVTRRKQNQYRRQQSLLARRVASFNSSPLNVCKLRALYRTLLTIDFAPPTNERPDPYRAYTAEEWTAYQRLANGGRAPHAHEVIDQFWWSPAVRSLLQILDVFANDQNARLKRKGRPKQPAPTFHLPAELWDRTSLPIIKPKDHNGLPLSGSAGIILFRFHVDEAVQQAFPDWADKLYDNPPVPEEDVLLPSLSEVMEASVFSHLRPRVKALRDASIVRRLSPEEVIEVNARPPPPEEPSVPDTSVDFGTDFMSKSLDEIFSITNSPFVVPGSSTMIQLPEVSSPGNGPSAGSSVRARRQAKRAATETPGGAATPVVKRVKTQGMADIAEQIVEKQVEEGIQGDTAFLAGL